MIRFILALIGWLMTWMLILGPTGALMSLASSFAGKSRIMSSLFGFIGLLGGFVIVGGLLPEETGTWTETYSRVFGFYFLTLKGWLVLLLGLSGWSLFFYLAKRHEGD